MAGEIINGVEVTSNVDRACDVCIVGSGAGGAVMAAGLAEAGLDVVLLEEGGYHTRQDFTGDEATAFPMLYQDGGTRSTDDLAITILQGRSVGVGPRSTGPRASEPRIGSCRSGKTGSAWTSAHNRRCALISRRSRSVSISIHGRWRPMGPMAPWREGARRLAGTTRFCAET